MTDAAAINSVPREGGAMQINAEYWTGARNFTGLGDDLRANVEETLC